MSAFKLAEAVMAILISIFLWIPLSYAVDLAVDAVNLGITDADAIAHNNQLGQLFYYTLFFIILACVVYVIKSHKDEEDPQVTYVQQPTFQLPNVIRAGFSGGAPGRITLVLGLFLLLTVPMASAWPVSMSGWEYRQAVNVNSSSSYTDIQVYINVPYDAHMETDFVDLRFLNNCSDDAVALDYCLGEDCGKRRFDVTDGDNADVWVEVPDVDSVICMYYGNSGASTTSDAFNTYVAYADWDNCTVGDSPSCQSWSETNCGSPHECEVVSVSGNNAMWQHVQGNVGHWGSSFTAPYVYIGTSETGPLVYEGWIYYNQTASGIGHIFYRQDTDDWIKNGQGYSSGADYVQFAWDVAGSSGGTTPNVALNPGWLRIERIDADDWSGDYSSDGFSWTNVDTKNQAWTINDFGFGAYQNVVNIGDFFFDELTVRRYNDSVITHDFYSEESATSIPNITISLGVSPSTLYNTTAANFSIFYNETSGYSADITINVSSDGGSLNNTGPFTFSSVAADTTLYYYVLATNYSKHDNITLTVNLTTDIAENEEESLTKEIQNSLPSVPTGSLYPRSVIIGDNLTTNVSSSDSDDDSVTLWYLFGWDNNTNITSWKLTDNLTILSGYENDTIRAWFKANDGEGNSSADYLDMNVTNLQITLPVQDEEYIGKDLYFAFSFDTEYYQECEEDISGTTYALGYINSDQNNSRTVWYDEDNTYTVTCYSWEDPSLSYSKTVNFTNYFANWSVSMFTENDWDVPLNITEANLSIFINCEGGSQYVYNFTGTTFYGVKPECDVQSITAKVDYSTDSYARERSVPDCRECDIRMYMVDALIYTVLQIPIYMSDYNYFDTRIELYKLSGGNHYTIAQGTFDVEHKYVTYLAKDNTYYIRLDQGTLGSQVRDIGYLYAASATAQYLSLSTINLRPDIMLISDNLLMSAEFDDPLANTSTLRISYQDLINMTSSVRIRVYSDTNNTAWYDQTFYGYDNLTVSLNNVNTTRQSVRFTVLHDVLGNSPVDFTVGVGAFGSDVDFGLGAASQWILAAAGFVVMLLTALIIVPEIRFYGILVLLAELGVFVGIRWFAFAPETVFFFIAALVAGFVYELKFKGVT